MIKNNEDYAMLNIFNSGNILLNKFSLVTNSNLDKILFSQLILFKNFMLDVDFFVPNNDPLVQLINDAMPHDYVNLIDEEIDYNIKNSENLHEFLEEYMDKEIQIYEQKQDVENLSKSKRETQIKKQQ